jgi:hypothetical protein
MNRNLKSNSKERGNKIAQQEKDLAALSKSLQKRFFDALMKEIRKDLTINSGIVVSSTENLNKVQASTLTMRIWSGIVGRDVSRFFSDGLDELMAANTDYFSTFKPQNWGLTKDIVLDKVGRISADFLTNYRQSETVAMAIKQTVISAVSRQVSYSDLRAELLEQIDGTAEKLGIIENYNMVQTRLQDAFSDYDRMLQNEFSERLDLNYCIYQGGLIGTSRSFCDERNANVYNRETVLSWQNEEWQGKKKGHNILVDAGGYNCRHYFDWISYEMAKQLSPDISKSVFDKP